VGRYRAQYLRVIHDKAIAFVTYYLRSSAEFAKEAMCDQHLGHGEVLNVRWATEDPNPRAKAQKYEDTEGQMLAAVRARYGDVGYFYPEYNQYAAPYYGAPNSFYNYYPLEYTEATPTVSQLDPENPDAPPTTATSEDAKEPPVKKLKITAPPINTGAVQPAFLAMYPNTDSQYPDMDFNKKDDRSPTSSNSQENDEHDDQHKHHEQDHLVTLQKQQQQFEQQAAAASSDPQSYYYNYSTGSYAQPGQSAYDYSAYQQYAYYYDPYQTSTDTYQNSYYQQQKPTKPIAKSNNEEEEDDDDDDDDDEDDEDENEKKNESSDTQIKSKDTTSVKEPVQESASQKNKEETPTEKEQVISKKETAQPNKTTKETPKSRKRKVTEDDKDNS